MDTEGFDPQKLHGAPPLMPWPKFAEWIGMGDEPIVVRTWLERGYLPSQKVGMRCGTPSPATSSRTVGTS